MLVKEIIHQPNRTIIPTLSRRASGMVKTHYYGTAPDQPSCSRPPSSGAWPTRGHPVLLPQYFGVHAEHRGRSHGRALWRAATTWAEHHRAAYQLLQTETGQASERLFLSEGFTFLGFAYSVAA